jgi:acetyl-CoA synthetase
VNATGAYRQSRDQLLHLRAEHARAVAEFRWPEVGTRFNWAVDWFDAIANGNDRPALVVVEEDGSATERTFAEMSRASDRLSSWLAARGVHKGDPVLLMLGNQVELWEAMLAIMKLGAVILPTTNAVGPADLGDRIARGRVRHVICNAADTGNSTGCPATTRGSASVRPRAGPTCGRPRNCSTPASRTRARRRTIRCCCTSLPVRRRGPSWSSTRRCPTRSAICLQCTDSACGPATCI